jgi:hypothetical protein
LAELVVEAAEKFYTSAEPRIAARLALADTSIAYHITDAEPLGFSLFFDREPIEFEARPLDNCEAHLYLTAMQILDVFRGRSHLTMGIARKEIQYRGPVRKYLTVIPCHRRMDFEPWTGLRQKAEAIANGSAPAPQGNSDWSSPDAGHEDQPSGSAEPYYNPRAFGESPPA